MRVKLGATPVAENMRVWRTSRFLTQQEAADLVGTSRSQWAQWELGSTHPGIHWRTRIVSLLDGDVSLSKEYKTVKQIEKETEDALSTRLRDAGVTYQRQVSVPAGVIDVLTDKNIYEIKAYLTRNSILKGVGQLLLYRASISGGERLGLVLVGRCVEQTVKLIPLAQQVGVRMQVWTDLHATTIQL